MLIRRLTKIGNGMGVLIPKAVAEMVGFKLGQGLRLEVSPALGGGGAIVIRNVVKKTRAAK